LKEGIGLRAYGQKDPLVEYKKEAFNIFLDLLGMIRDEVISFCFKFFPQAPEDVKEQKRKRPARMRTIKSSVTNMGIQSASGDQAAQRGKQQPIKVEVKVGRNDPCPCGSGKKYKHCHGKNQ
jgi:preprotein translocase subunit SecA